MFRNCSLVPIMFCLHAILPAGNAARNDHREKSQRADHIISSMELGQRQQKMERKSQEEAHHDF